MKNFTFNFLVILLSGFFVFTACKKDDDNPDPTPEELQVQKLTGTWIVGTEGSVIRDDFSSNEWEDFTLTMGNKTYSTTNTYPTVWPTQGTWDFVGDNPNQIEREDGLIIDISVTETTLTMTFTQPDKTSGGRIAGITGEYIFVLVKKQ